MRPKAKIISDISYVGIIPHVRAETPEQIIPICEALLSGGISIFELNMAVPNAIEVLKKVVAQYGQRALIGMGSVLNGATARAAVDAGAEFLSTPVAKLEVVAVGRATQRPILLGAYSPSEATLAYEAGADFVRLFPADLAGPGYVKTLRTFLPNLKLVASSGMNLENSAGYIKAGATAVAVDSALITDQILQESNWAELKRLAGEYVRVIRAAKDGK